MHKFLNAFHHYFNPYYIYHYSRLIHAIRLGIAVLLATWIVRSAGLEHGQWAPMTVFVVLGMLQFQGAIYTKAIERLIGTLVGLLVGLGILWLNQNHLHNNALFFCLVGAFSALSGWAAVGKKGYIPMLAGLTVCMLIGDEQSSWLNDGLMRGCNVFIGVLISLLASKLVPLKSTLMWRFLLSDNMTHAERIIANISQGEPLNRARWQTVSQQMKAVNTRLVRSRSHLAATAQESHISNQVMESIQHSHRKIVSSTDLLLNATPKLPRTHISEADQALLAHHFLQLRHDMRIMAYYMRGRYAHRMVIRPEIQPEIRTLAQRLPFEWQGFVWLSINMRMEMAALAHMLMNTRRQWMSTHEIKRLNTHHSKRPSTRKKAV